MIDPKCCRCHKELEKKGGVLLMPPSGIAQVGTLEGDLVDKLHLCVECANDVVMFLELTATPLGVIERPPCTLENCGHMRQLDAIVDLLGMHRGGISVLDELRKRAEAEWSDTPDEWTAAIEAAHPAHGSESHDEYGTAMQMVGHRHGKGELVALVNWLLVRIKQGKEPVL